MLGPVFYAVLRARGDSGSSKKFGAVPNNRRVEEIEIPDSQSHNIRLAFQITPAEFPFLRACDASTSPTDMMNERAGIACVK